MCYFFSCLFIFFSEHTNGRRKKKERGEKGKNLDGALSEQASELLMEENVSR